MLTGNNFCTGFRLERVCWMATIWPADKGKLSPVINESTPRFHSGRDFKKW